MPKCREILLVSERPRDDGRAIANEIAEFLTFYAHQVVYLCSSHSATHFQTASYNGLLLKKCTLPSVADYISKAKRPLARWISYQRLNIFSVVLFDDNGGPTSEKKKVAEFRVRFFQPEIMPVPKMRQFKVYFDKLKQQLRDVLMGLHSAENLNQMDFVGKPLIVELFCTLAAGTSIVDRHGEHCWREAEVGQQFLCTPFVEPVNENVCCELAQMRFISLISGDAGLRRECPEEPEVEYSMLSAEE